MCQVRCPMPVLDWQAWRSLRHKTGCTLRQSLRLRSRWVRRPSWTLTESYSFERTTWQTWCHSETSCLLWKQERQMCETIQSSHLLQIPTSLAFRYVELMSIDLQVLCDQFQLWHSACRTVISQVVLCLVRFMHWQESPVTNWNMTRVHTGEVRPFMHTTVCLGVFLRACDTVFLLILSHTDGQQPVAQHFFHVIPWTLSPW